MNPFPTPINTPTPVLPSPTVTYTYTSIPTNPLTPIPTLDLCCEEILNAISTNQGLIISGSAAILSKLNDLPLIRNDKIVTNSLIHSATHTLLSEIQAGRTEIGMSNASLHDALNLLQSQQTSSTEVLSASIGSIKILPLLKEDFLTSLRFQNFILQEAPRIIN